MGRTGGFIRGGEDAPLPLAARPRGSGSLCCRLRRSWRGRWGWEWQHRLPSSLRGQAACCIAVLAAHVTTMTRRLDNLQREGQAPVAEAEAAIGQTTINQKASAIAEETEVVAVAATAAAVARGSGGSGNGDSGRGAWCNGGGGGRQRWRKQTTINQIVVG